MRSALRQRIRDSLVEWHCTASRPGRVPFVQSKQASRQRNIAVIDRIHMTPARRRKGFAMRVSSPKEARRPHGIAFCRRDAGQRLQTIAGVHDIVRTLIDVQESVAE